MTIRITENNHGNGKFTYEVQADCYSNNGIDGIMNRLFLQPQWVNLATFKTQEEAKDYLSGVYPVSSRVISERPA